MKSFVKNTFILALLFLVTSCTNDFLDENITQVYLPVGESNIYISPNWENSTYLFKLLSVKEGEFEIVSKPSWLNITPLKGNISDSMAVVQCSVAKNPDFDAVGIYMDFMTLAVDGEKYKVPVAYITEGNPKAQVQNPLTISYNTNNNPTLRIQNNGLGILHWEITSLPKWLVLDTASLDFNGLFITQYTTYNIPFKFKLDSVYTGSLTGKIVLATNDREQTNITVDITADLGTPQLYLYTNAINFSYTETSAVISMGNNGNGTLVWELTNLPEWLTATPSSGTFFPYMYSQNITFTCDRTKLSPGQNSASVILKTNDSAQPQKSIRVIAAAPGISQYLHAIDGNLIDAAFNKNTNTLYYVTSSPNKLVIFDITGKTVLDEIALSKAPTSLAVAESWDKAAVGHNGLLSSISLSGKTVTATYPLDYSVNDLAWAENDWFCFTQVGGSSTALHWVNTTNGSLYDDPNKHNLDGNSTIKKVPGQPYLIATRNYTSPGGFFAFDIATKSQKSYSHMGLGNFWFSNDGEYTFSSGAYIYRTTSSTGSTNTFDTDIYSIGKIATGNANYIEFQNLYHSNNFLWVLQSESYSSDESSAIYQIEDNDYTLVKKIDYDLIYNPNAQTAAFYVSANYVFANNAETEIAVLCKGINNNSWVLQFIPVK